MEVKVLMTLCLTFLLSVDADDMTTKDMLCQLGKQMNHDISRFECSQNDEMALYKELMEKMEAESKKKSVGTQLEMLLENMGVKSNMAQMNKVCQMARLINKGPFVECSEDLMKIFRVLDPESKIDGNILKTFLHTFLTANDNKEEEKSPVNIVSMILNVLMPNSHTMTDQIQRDLLAMVLKVAEILRSPPYTSLDHFTLLKVLESCNASNPEKLLRYLQTLVAYQERLTSWEIEFILEFRQFFPPSLESKIITIVLDMVTKDERPLDIAKHLVMFLPQTEQLKVMQTIMKYGKEVIEPNSHSCGIRVNEEVHEMLKTIGDEIKDIKKRQSKREVMEIMKWSGWKRVFAEEQEYDMFKDMVSFIESSYGTNTFMWLHGMLNWMDKEAWPRDLLKRILTSVNQNKKVKASIVKTIMADEKFSDFIYKVHLWMKTQTISKFSSDIQMIHQFISSINFSQHNEEEQWLQGFFDWLDNNFGNSEELTKTIKAVSSSMVNKTWIYSLLGEIDEKIGVRVIIQHGQVICNRSVSVTKQSVQNILTAAKGTNDLCGLERFEFFHRASVMNKKVKGKYIFRINDITDNDYFKWIVSIKINGGIILKDIDVSYIPENMDHIYVKYTDPKTVG